VVGCGVGNLSHACDQSNRTVLLLQSIRPSLVRDFFGFGYYSISVLFDNYFLIID